MAVDRETVNLFSTYRVGLLPPRTDSLTPGELYVELNEAGPRLWVGALKDTGYEGDNALLVMAAPPTDPPVNVMVPYLQQTGDILSCTMGTWTGSPTDYAYAWWSDSTLVDEGGPDHVINPEEVNTTMTCIVTATNQYGSTSADPSNGVFVTGP